MLRRSRQNSRRFWARAKTRHCRMASEDGAAGRMHAGPDRCHARRQEGTVRLSGRYRESAQNWKELLVDLKARGLAAAPSASWKALDEAFPTTHHQRCWVHKTVNVLEKCRSHCSPRLHADTAGSLSPSRARPKAVWADDPLPASFLSYSRQDRSTQPRGGCRWPSPAGRLRQRAR